jgi:hypothetical protein
MSPPDWLGEDYTIFSQPLTMRQVSHSSSPLSFNKRLLYGVNKSVKVSPSTRPTRKSFECGPQLDDFMAPNFNKANQRAHFCPKWLPTILMGSLLEQPSVFFSFFLFVAPSPSCIAQEKKKEKKKVQVFCNYSLRHCKL